jgi:HSP20 family protein
MNERSFLPKLWGVNDDNFNPFNSLHREIDRVFGEFNRGLLVPETHINNGSFNIAPRVNVSETDKTMEISAELPGVEDKDIEVTVVDGALQIKAEKKAEKEDKAKNYHLVERSYGVMQRSIPLSFNIDADKIKANFDKGVLNIILPKPPEAEAKKQKVKIKSAAA